MKKQIYIRADGSASIGLGHVVRALALAHMLKDNFSIQFMCMEIPVGFAEEVRTEGFSIKLIDSEESFFSLLTGNEIVILDHYGLETEYQKKIKRIGSKLVCIDDLHDKEFYADLIINHAPGIVPEDYKAQDYTQFALGLDYALLRPPFLKIAKEKKQIIDITKVFICFGGADPDNLTASVLEEVVNWPEIKQIHVILGAAYKGNLPKTFFDDSKEILYHSSITDEEMAKIMILSDLAIVPASGILLEVLAAGCKVINSYYVENQKSIFNGFRSLEGIHSIDHFKDLGRENYINILNSSSIDEKIIDGESQSRLLERFIEISK